MKNTNTSFKDIPFQEKKKVNAAKKRRTPVIGPHPSFSKSRNAVPKKLTPSLRQVGYRTRSAVFLR